MSIIKKYKPTSPGVRGMSVAGFEEITVDRPHKPLIAGKKRKSGRNNQGRITTRHQGGGHKRNYRIIDFKRDKNGVPGVVKTIEYDPNRSARICLINYVDGDKRYILWPKGLKVGDKVMAGDTIDIASGNSTKLKNIPVGSLLHNIELKPGKGGQMARSAGSFATLMAKENDYAQLKLKSGEIRLVLLECMATIGEIGNSEHSLIKVGKAGRSRWLGKRPTVRGMAMNPVDHPHGGGEGRGKGGNHPQSPTGVLSKGYKTRKNKRSSKYIIKRIN